jgi:hypothetical protein
MAGTNFLRNSIRSFVRTEFIGCVGGVVRHSTVVE